MGVVPTQMRTSTKMARIQLAGKVLKLHYYCVQLLKTIFFFLKHCALITPEIADDKCCFKLCRVSLSLVVL